MSAGYMPLPQTSTQALHDDRNDCSSDADEASVYEPLVRSVLAPEQDAHAGVRKVEAAQRVYGRYSRWCLFVGLGLASYIYSLDASTTYAYLTFATSYFGEHSLISSITVAQSLIVAVGKPVIAKVADVSSRGTAYVSVLIFYVLGYTVIASAPNVSAIAGGIVLYAVGYTGLQLLTQIIIADITTLAWRGLVVSLVSAPFLINAFIGSIISSAVLKSIGWRWGYGMFAILVPVSLAPLIITLLWAERRAKKLDILDSSKSRSRSNSRQPSLPDSSGSMMAHFLRSAEQLDLVGLVLLGLAVSLTLLPLTISRTGAGYWKNGSIIAMLVMGVVLLAVFAVWDLRYASRPVIAPRFVRNRSVVCAAFIGFFDFMSYYLTYTYLYSFVLVVKPWSLVNATYFIQIQSVALTFFGILAGISMRFLHRYKYVLVIGLVIRLAGVALMIHSRGGNASDAELVWTQILQGFGGGFAAVSSQVGAQASVSHADVAIITAVVLLVTEIGGAVGNACAGAIWSNTMPFNLEKYLPWLTNEERAELYGSIKLAASYPLGHPVREGVISAYDDTMRIMVIAATVLSVVPILLALVMPNWYLGDKQNAIDAVDLTGRSELEDDVEDEEEL
ncbi:major facilitator superfamily domain-containing protein [Suillus bovinus]|uniref:major facilitator superfamily domain-containing protein n=1 Tax=Suillus bovinus TaxID=48563 RepID=UPI001B85FCD9|nr:major facilitator superfamily domain-containing protein [Suillus bovinus]KAG2131593.1 major facilitator superfamily domain-containing protein [Suillus bovinus]